MDTRTRDASADSRNFSHGFIPLLPLIENNSHGTLKLIITVYVIAKMIILKGESEREGGDPGKMEDGKKGRKSIISQKADAGSKNM
jgi:hypothetical protein